MSTWTVAALVIAVCVLVVLVAGTAILWRSREQRAQDAENDRRLAALTNPHGMRLPLEDQVRPPVPPRAGPAPARRPVRVRPVQQWPYRPQDGREPSAAAVAGASSAVEDTYVIPQLSPGESGVFATGPGGRHHLFERAEDGGSVGRSEAPPESSGSSPSSDPSPSYSGSSD